MKHTAKLLALLIIFGLAGCAGTRDMDSMRTQSEQANATAEAALRVANEANLAAQEAKAIATEANATAQKANATSQTTEDKIDRMFKKAMYK